MRPLHILVVFTILGASNALAQPRSALVVFQAPTPELARVVLGNRADCLFISPPEDSVSRLDAGQVANLYRGRIQDYKLSPMQSVNCSIDGQGIDFKFAIDFRSGNVWVVNGADDGLQLSKTWALPEPLRKTDDRVRALLFQRLLAELSYPLLVKKCSDSSQTQCDQLAEGIVSSQFPELMPNLSLLLGDKAAQAAANGVLEALEQGSSDLMVGPESPMLAYCGDDHVMLSFSISDAKFKLRCRNAGRPANIELDRPLSYVELPDNCQGSYWSLTGEGIDLTPAGMSPRAVFFGEPPSSLPLMPHASGPSAPCYAASDQTLMLVTKHRLSELNDSQFASPVAYSSTPVPLSPVQADAVAFLRETKSLSYSGNARRRVPRLKRIRYGFEFPIGPVAQFALVPVALRPELGSCHVDQGDVECDVTVATQSCADVFQSLRIESIYRVNSQVK